MLAAAGGALALVLLLWCVVASLRRWWERSGCQLTIRETAWPVLQHLPTVIALTKPDPQTGGVTLQDWFIQKARESGFRSYAYSFPWATEFVIHSPENCQHVMKTRFGTHYVLGEHRRGLFRTLLGDGIFNADGDTWKLQRSSSSHMFSARQLRSRMVAVFKQNAAIAADILAKHAATGEHVDLQQLMYRYTFDSFMAIAFSRNAGSLSGDPAGVAVQAAFDRAQVITNMRFSDPLWKVSAWLGVGVEREMVEVVRIVDKYIVDGLRARGDHADAVDAVDDADLVSLYCETCAQEGRTYTERDLRDLVVNFVLAGRDTTASAMTWGFYELARHPAERARAEEDVHAHDDVSEMHYLQAVFQEALRLHPPVPLDFKECIQDDTLPDGTRVRKGCLIGFHPVAFCRNPALYPDPDAFRPARWLNDDGTCRHYDEYAFPCFNAGPRLCLGRHMAALEVKIMFTEVMSELRVDLAPGFAPAKGMMLVTNSPNGMMARISSRRDGQQTAPEDAQQAG